MNFNIERLEKNFNIEVSGNKKQKGRLLLQAGKLLHLKEYIDKENGFVEVVGTVLSERTYSTYKAGILIDTDICEIEDTTCDCIDFSNNNYKDKYICKHIVAVMEKYIIEKKVIHKQQKRKFENMGEYIIKELQELNSPKEKVNLEIYLTKTYNDFFEVDFKIGNKKKYVLKNLKEFIAARIKNEKIVYGKEFTYCPNSCEFDKNDEKIVDFIEEYVVNEHCVDSYSSIFVKGKYLRIYGNLLRRFLELLDKQSLNYNSEKVSVIKEDIPVDFNITQESEKYILNFSEKTLTPLNNKRDVFMLKGDIYLPSKSQMRNINVFYKYFNEFKTIEFKKEKAIDMFNTVVPSLKKITPNIKIDESINNLVKEDLKVEFFLDIRKKEVVLSPKLKYGDQILEYFSQGNKEDKIIIRDTEKEDKILETLTGLNFEYKNNIFIFNGDEYNLYLFLKDEYRELEMLGDVYYSDKFKEKKVYSTPKIEANIKEENDFLNFNFKIEDIDPKEYKNILDAFKNKRKYYKLKNDSFINLEDEQINDFLGLVDNINSGNKDENIKFHKNKAIVINEYLENKNLNFVKGKKIIEDISNKVCNLEKINYELPKDLKTNLRAYQITGFKWFKNLSYLGFGGILADEMGLGKTVQTIAFLLSEIGKKSIIIAPTSLVYNWKNEFLKFAPSMKVCIIHGNKNEREKYLQNIDEYDVILTTYGTLKNDLENYKNLMFDYCILDEGQNIKNPLAQSTKAVKNVKAKSKFVLTGTPIENNLIELWSIFDFLMPNYLYSTSIFKKKFINDENSKIELQKYIRPFMLRRLKKDVIKELPDKIEKNHYVELTKEQKKVYVSYVKDIKKKMEDKNFKGDKITIFSYLTKLRQLCLDPSIVVENYKGKSAKFDEAISIIQENIKDNHKILLFSQFTSVLSNISNELSKQKIEYLYLDGSTDAKKRLKLVDEFNTSDKVKIFLISLKAGGTGLNLTCADIVIHFDPWWNPAVEEQATDRAHRIGQKNVVQVFRLISEGTIEERILNLQENKKELINNVLNSDYNKDDTISSLSKEELIELFS